MEIDWFLSWSLQFPQNQAIFVFGNATKLSKTEVKNPQVVQDRRIVSMWIIYRPSIFRKFFREKFVHVFRFFREKKRVRKMREMRKKICHIFGYFGPILMFLLPKCTVLGSRG